MSTELFIASRYLLTNRKEMFTCCAASLLADEVLIGLTALISASVAALFCYYTVSTQ